MKKTKLTRSLLAAVSIVALSAVMYGCTHDGDDPPVATPAEMCTDDGGTWADGECTTAEDLAAEMLAEQREAIETAIGAASAAVAAVDNDSTDAQVSAADTAIMNARSAIADAGNVPAGEKAANTGTVNALAMQLSAAKSSRQMAMDDAQSAADAAMMATAMKLHDGISAHASTGDAIRNATYDGDNIAVTIGTASAVTLSEDMKTMVSALHGWEGKKYTASGTGVDGMYEAMVYSNVGEPTEGAMISTILTDGAVPNATLTNTENAGNVASPMFDQSAGAKTFPLPDPNPTGETMVVIAGTYSGVAGNYSCTPTGNGTDCSATVATSGFTLGGGTWAFTPTDTMARLMSTPDAIYASYGWWIHKSADDKTYTASAFAADKGNVPDASGITVLRGTATYMGGAAGKYALYSSTGGTNDAGHFTAMATLEANFNDDTISGTIDSFMGADGEARDWSVELMKSTVSDTGGIAGDPATDGSTDAQMTVWTIDGTAAAAAGQWSGSLQHNGDDLVPMVATGTFHSMYSTAGNMVGAFGANKE